MKIVADVQVNHRLTSSYNMPRRRSQRSTLSFTSKSAQLRKNEELYLIHNTQNGATMYKVKSNLVKVFDKFSNEGKVTILFKEPPHELIIKSDRPLTSFVDVLKMVYKGISPGITMKLTSFSKEMSKKVPPKPKTHLTFLSKSQYPYTEGFPRSAVSIVINGVEQRQLDMRLLGLPNLTMLDLSNNCLSTIPPEIDLLSSLNVLTLNHNNLGNASPFTWQWLEGENLRRNLEELDLCDNELCFLSPAVCRLRKLKVLKVSNNNLVSLPNAIGTIPALRSLLAANNKLKFLPGSAWMLRLWILDVSQNPFIFNVQGLVSTYYQVPTLLEWAARTTADNRISYSPPDLPLVVRQYLDTVSFCQCRRACFEASIRVYSEVSMSSLAQSVLRNYGEIADVPVEVNLCCYRCVAAFNGRKMISILLP